MYRGFSIYKTDVFLLQQSQTHSNTSLQKQLFHLHPPLRNTNTFITALTNAPKQHKQHIYSYIQTMHFMQKQYTSNPTPDTASKHISLCRISVFLIPPRHTKPTASRPTLSKITTPKLYIENYQSISKNRRTNQTRTHSLRRQPQATRHHIKESHPPQPHHRTLSAL